jgi:hypothetical protein
MIQVGAIATIQVDPKMSKMGRQKVKLQKRIQKLTSQ